jgi:hypothetical protein
LRLSSAHAIQCNALYVVRASTFVAEAIGGLSKSPGIVVPVQPVVGGQSRYGLFACHILRYIDLALFMSVIRSLLSQLSHPLPAALDMEGTHKAHPGGDEVIKLKTVPGLQRSRWHMPVKNLQSRSSRLSPAKRASSLLAMYTNLVACWPPHHHS